MPCGTRNIDLDRADSADHCAMTWLEELEIEYQQYDWFMTRQVAEQWPGWNLFYDRELDTYFNGNGEEL